MRRVLFLVFLFYLFFSKTYSIETVDIPIILLSVPKSGTNLAIKCISLLTKKQCKYKDVSYPGSFKNTFYMYHFYFYSRLNFFDKNIKLIFNMRDLRDVIISLYRKRTIKHPYLTTANLWNSKSVNEKIMYFLDVINLKEDFNTLNEIKIFFSLIKKNPGILTIKFENLVGEKGGGSLKLQKKEIKKIADYLSINITDQEITDIAKNLFGETPTFMTGQIGSWKKYFNEEHKNKFKKHLGEHLIKLGYEKDNNW